ncbi:YybH family protein [Hydrotalea sp.]|uniref:YybH family protein n=1 Tax=Hydrotalea sp. TaxID=2881279 RepID=UPI003D122108
MKKRYFLFHLLLLFITYLPAQTTKATKAITEILQRQENAWNNGNLDDFMLGYWQNDSLQFIGKNGPVYGYKTTLKNYKNHYSTKAAMGHFTSTILQMKPLGKKFYYVTGKWQLDRTIGNVEGYYTLLFQKINGQWVIISDHSS